jgi:short-subunit dehydrogenase
VGSLRATRGRLVVVGSASGYLPYGGLGIYNASKFAVRGMTRQLRYELARSGVTVTHVAPGAVATSIWPGDAPPNAMTPHRAAALIAAGIDAGRGELAFPRRTTLEIHLSRYAPVLHERLLRRAWRG